MVVQVLYLYVTSILLPVADLMRDLDLPSPLNFALHI